jgi:hypothetical protein
MVKNLNIIWIIVGMVAVFTLYSCDDFYSTSWGEPREYDLSKIKLTQSNLKAWKEKAAGNPKLAKALVNKIIEELKSKSGAEKAAFQKAGIELSIEQAGIGTKIIELAGSSLDKISGEDEGAIRDMLNKVQNGLKDVDAAAGNIAKIVGSSVNGTGSNEKPSFDSAYVAAATPSEVGMAVMVLALATIPEIKEDTELSELATLIPNFQFEDGEVTIGDGKTPSNEELALAAYLNLITSDTEKFDNNLITSGIISAFDLGNTK